jgi:hypothetical protein
MDDGAGLIERHPSIDTQSCTGYTHDATQDVAAQRVFVLQPKVGQYGRLVLRNRVAIDRSINTKYPQERRKPTNEGAG